MRRGTGGPPLGPLAEQWDSVRAGHPVVVAFLTMHGGTSRFRGWAAIYSRSASCHHVLRRKAVSKRDTAESHGDALGGNISAMDSNFEAPTRCGPAMPTCCPHCRHVVESSNLVCPRPICLTPPSE